MRWLGVFVLALLALLAPVRAEAARPPSRLLHAAFHYEAAAQHLSAAQHHSRSRQHTPVSPASAAASCPRPAIALKTPVHADTMATLRQQYGAGAFIGPNLVEVPWQHCETLLRLGIAQHLHCLKAAPPTPSSATRSFTGLNMYSRAATQSGHHMQTPLSELHLDGQDQVVAVADTGVDYDNCFFDDPNHEIPFERVNLQHRKVVTYQVIPTGTPLVKDTRHGTHTAASVAGQVLTPDAALQAKLGEFNGMAPAAKLALFDLGEKASMRIPTDLYNELFTKIYSTPARISSNSWGAPIEDVTDDAYDIYALAVDKFTWDHPDFLTLFGAGNWGGQMARLYQTIGTPALAKNALTVGSCTSFAQSFKKANVVLTSFLRVIEPGDDPVVSGLHVYVQAEFGPELISFDSRPYFVTIAEPRHACTPLKNSRELEGAMVIVYIAARDCPLTQRVLNVQKAKGSAVIFLYSDSGHFPLVDKTVLDTDITIPSIGVELKIGSHIATLANTSNVVIKAPEDDPRAHQKHSFGYVSDFSSRGPTIDGRIKPDILGPGEWINSAKGDNNLNSHQCEADGISAKKGTSMATPIVAGNVAQIRQYLTEGWYPTGKKDAGNAIPSPSAALLKALVINSGVAVGGWVDTYTLDTIEVDAPPSNIQGFGRVQLDRVLPLADLTLTNQSFHLKLFDGVNITTSQFQHYCINVVDSLYPLKITLVWSDYPADISAEYLLVNNLDLFAVEVESNTHWFGNRKQAYAADGVASEKFVDASNNVEQITMASPSSGLLGIHIHGTNVPQGPQPFALVITGRFTMAEKIDACSGSVICPSDCSSHGECKDGQCQCTPGFAGVDCSLESQPFPERGEVTGAILLGEWTYFHTDVNETAPASMVVKLSRIGSVGDPDLFVAFEYIPFLGSSHWSNLSRLPDSQVVIPKGQLRSGRYYIGVHAACCAHTDFMLSVKTTVVESESEKKELPVPQSSRVWPTLLLLLALGIVMALAVFVLRDMTGAHAYRYQPVGAVSTDTSADQQMQTLRRPQGFLVNHDEESE